ncbi:MAG TPA: hypothetical protein VFV38_42465 [Ktedonobacteraceae bacterium]|nr:hypothetical protein [Ktedonobacteraceae bacterium]
MTTQEHEAGYEAARSWTLQPFSHPPPGWARVVRYGLATWINTGQPPMLPSSEATVLNQSDCSPLLSILAAMIAEVCQ